jgi:hypothetical protein
LKPGTTASGAYHNTGGLAFWFLRAERYEPQDGMPYIAVRHRVRRLMSNEACDDSR